MLWMCNIKLITRPGFLFGTGDTGSGCGDVDGSWFGSLVRLFCRRGACFSPAISATELLGVVSSTLARRWVCIWDSGFTKIKMDSRRGSMPSWYSSSTGLTATITPAPRMKLSQHSSSGNKPLAATGNFGLSWRSWSGGSWILGLLLRLLWPATQRS